MKRIAAILVSLVLFSITLCAQEAGNRSYGGQKRKPLVNTGVLTGNADDKTRVYYVEANVLMNVKADAYVAVFGVVQEGPTSAESNTKLDTQINGFMKDLDVLGVKKGDVFVDFINQNKVYDYTTSANAVTEILGF